MNKEINISVNKILTYMYFILIQIMYGLSYSPLEIKGIFHDVLLYSAFICVCTSLFISQKKIPHLIRTILVIFVSFLVYFIAQETIFLIMVFSAIMVKGNDYRKIFKVIFFVRLTTTLIVICSSLIGIIPLGQKLVPKGRFGYVSALSLGFTHPNNLGQIVFFLCALYVCYKSDSIRKRNIFVIFIVDILLYYISKSKSACLLILFICLMCLIKDKKHEMLRNLFGKLFLALSVLMPLFCIVTSYVYILNNNTLLNKIAYIANGFLNGRISNASMMFSQFDLTLFGEHVDLYHLKNVYGYNVVDNGYVYSLFNFGLIPFVIICFLYTFSIQSMLKKDKWIYIVIIMCFLFYAVSENILRSMMVNFTTIFWWEFFSKQENIYVMLKKMTPKNKKRKLLIEIR